MARRGITLFNNQNLPNQPNSQNPTNKNPQSRQRGNVLLQSGISSLIANSQQQIQQSKPSNSKLISQGTMQSGKNSVSQSQVSQEPQSSRRQMQRKKVNELAPDLQKHLLNNLQKDISLETLVPVTIQSNNQYDKEKQRKFQAGASLMASSVLPPFRFGEDDEDIDNYHNKEYKPDKNNILGNFFPIMKYVSPIYVNAQQNIEEGKVKPQDDTEYKELLDGYRQIGKITVETYVNGKSILKQEGKFSEAALAQKELEEKEKNKKKNKKKREEEEKLKNEQNKQNLVQFQREAYVISFSPWFQNEETIFNKFSTLHQQFVDATAGEGGGQQIYGNNAYKTK